MLAKHFKIGCNNNGELSVFNSEIKHIYIHITSLLTVNIYRIYAEGIPR